MLGPNPLSAQAQAPSRPSGADKQQEPAENEGSSRPGLTGPRSDRADVVARRHCQKSPSCSAISGWRKRVNRALTLRIPMRCYLADGAAELQVRSNVSVAVHSSSPVNAPPAGGLVSGGRRGPYPCFLALGTRGWSAGRRQGACEAPFTGLAIGRRQRAKIPGPKCLRGWGSRGARALGVRALRLPALQRGTRCRRPHPAPSRNAAIDDAFE